MRKQMGLDCHGSTGTVVGAPVVAKDGPSLYHDEEPGMIRV